MAANPDSPSAIRRMPPALLLGSPAPAAPERPFLNAIRRGSETFPMGGTSFMGAALIPRALFYFRRR
jgi:hypothetical protein